MQGEFYLLDGYEECNMHKIREKTKRYQAVTVKSGVDTSEEEPAGPQIL